MVRRTPAAEAVEALLVTARLKPCPFTNPSPQTLLFFSQQVPGFAVGAVEAGTSGVVARDEEETGAVVNDVDGQGEPGVFGNDVGDKKVNFVEAMSNHAAVGAAVRIDVVETVEEHGRAFNLDTPQAMSGYPHSRARDIKIQSADHSPILITDKGMPDGGRWNWTRSEAPRCAHLVPFIRGKAGFPVETENDSRELRRS